MLKHFAGDESGNFAIITGLIGAVLVGAMGGVLDLSTQWIDQSAVQRAVDAAALAGAKALETGTEIDARKAVEVVANANLPEGFPKVTFSAQIDQIAGTVVVSGEGETKPYFLGLFDIKSLPIGSSAKALIQRKSYIDFHFLLDVSESMNIAASDADRLILQKITQNFNNRRCAFACHIIEPAWAPISVYEMNQRQKVEDRARLRIDVLRDASISMVKRILGLNSQPGSLKSTQVATAGFGIEYTPGVGPTSNEDLLIASIKGLSGNSHTDPDLALTKLKLAMGKQGKGLQSDDTKKFAILVTDGVRDINFSSIGLGPFNTGPCAAIKDAGIELAVLEIKYVEDRDVDGFFNQRVAGYYDRISPSLKNCASPGLYYMATDSAQAESQLLNMIDDLLTVRRRLAG